VKNEAELTKRVIALAHDYGWKVCRFHRMPVPRAGKTQWRTPVGADGKGWPDLTLCRERVVFAELKMWPKKPDVNQQAWLDWLRAAGQEAYVWTERDVENGRVDHVLKSAMTPLALARMTIACDGDAELARAAKIGAAIE